MWTILWRAFICNIVIIIVPLITFSDTLTTKLPDGRSVLLFPDGHWSYAATSTEPAVLQPAGNSIPAKRSFSHPPFGANLFSDFCYISRYDKFKDRTLNSVTIVLQKNGIYGLSLDVLYAYPGTTPTPPSFVTIMFHATSEDWEYLKDTHLSMLYDGIRKNFGDLDHDGTVGDGYVMEHMSTSIPLEDFLTLINSKVVEGQLFTTEFKLSNEQLEAFRDFASRMQQ